MRIWSMMWGRVLTKFKKPRSQSRLTRKALSFFVSKKWSKFVQNLQIYFNFTETKVCVLHAITINIWCFIHSIWFSWFSLCTIARERYKKTPHTCTPLQCLAKKNEITKLKLYHRHNVRVHRYSALDGRPGSVANKRRELLDKLNFYEHVCYKLLNQ